MVSSIVYSGDGTTRIFPVDFKILGENFVRVYVDDVEVTDKRKYDIINNSIVFNEEETPQKGQDNVTIIVATSESELGELGAPLTDIVIVAQNIADINAVGQQVVPNLPEILLADDNAAIATQKALEASNSATSASESATTATTQAGIATTKAGEASTSANNASISEANALGYRNEALSSATTATTQAGIATTKAGEASASASNASTSEANALAYRNEASTHATTATTQAGIATTQAGIATTKAGEASTKADEASASANNASTSEANALAYRNEASTHATTATTQAGIATTKAGEASASASAALTSRNQAETFAQQAQLSAESVDAGNLVHKTGDETIDGIKTFTSNIAGNITGNSATATKLQTPRTITLSGDVSGSTSFDGSANVTLSAQVANDSHSHSTSTITGLGTAAYADVTTSRTDTTAGRIMKVGDFGLGASTPVSDANDATIGSFQTSGQITNLDAKNNNFPYLSSKADSSLVWWNIETFGSGTRTTQIANQAFNTDGQPLSTYIRTHHDSTWSAWKEIATTEYVDNKVDLSNYVNLLTNQNISGTKTFTSSPIAPTPTAGNQVATKEYVDNNSVSVSDFANLKSTNGYQKLPNGLILQWGKYYSKSLLFYVTLPIAFPSSGLVSMCSPAGAPTSDPPTVGSVFTSKSQIKVRSSINDGTTVCWLAIGY
jgi:hypothetical protein